MSEQLYIDGLDAVAILAWIRCNPGRALRAQVDSLDITPFLTGHSPKLVRRFCDKAGISVEELASYGVRAGALRCDHSRRDRVHEYALGLQTPLYPSLQFDWRAIDATVPDVDAPVRYEFGPVRAERTSGIDALLCCGLAMDVGRLCADQMSPRREYALSAPAHALIRIVRHRWGHVQQATRDQLRNLFRDTVLAALAGASDSDTAIDLVFNGIPQTSFVTLACTVDCDDRLHFTPATSRPRSSCSVRVGAHGPGTLADRVNALFEANRIQTPTSPCDLHTGCVSHHWTTPVILDRPPATLIVRIPSINRDFDKRLLPFGRFRLRYRGTSSMHWASYVPQGCIITGRDQSAVLWIDDQSEEGYFLYDGLRGGRRRAVMRSGWWQAVGNGWINTVIFRSQGWHVDST